MGKVGIYWLTRQLDAFFIALTYDLDSGLPYGKWIISPEDHATYWDAHRQELPISSLSRLFQEEYYRLPRGRVSFDTESHRYTVYHGNWLSPAIKKLLRQGFDLKANKTVFEFDLHYSL